MLLITKAELQQFQAAPLEAVVVSYWKEKGDTETCEVRIAKAPGKGRRLNVYYPDGDRKTASMLQWKQARVRAEITQTQTATPPKALPWPLEPAIQAAMEGEWQEHRRLLPLKKWERLFRWIHPDSREKVWAEFEMLCFCPSGSEISAPQSPSSRQPTVTVHRSFFTESRSFSAKSSALDKGKSFSLNCGKFELRTSSNHREINRNPPTR